MIASGKVILPGGLLFYKPTMGTTRGLFYRRTWISPTRYSLGQVTTCAKLISAIILPKTQVLPKKSFVKLNFHMPNAKFTCLF